MYYHITLRVTLYNSNQIKILIKNIINLDRVLVGYSSLTYCIESVIRILFNWRIRSACPGQQFFFVYCKFVKLHKILFQVDKSLLWNNDRYI